ncbi:hypothetical protein ABZX51_007118 [Aspergillus tubingensis]
MSFNISQARSRFPALNQEQIFLDNAGGSQVLDTVIESVTSYLSKTNVQLGATYNTSKASTAAYDHGYKAAAKFINAKPEEVCKFYPSMGNANSCRFAWVSQQRSSYTTSPQL